MSDVAGYHVLVCALFPVQGGMWTYARLHPPKRFKKITQIL